MRDLASLSLIPLGAAAAVGDLASGVQSAANFAGKVLTNPAMAVGVSSTLLATGAMAWNTTRELASAVARDPKALLEVVPEMPSMSTLGRFAESAIASATQANVGRVMQAALSDFYEPKWLGGKLDKAGDTIETAAKRVIAKARDSLGEMDANGSLSDVGNLFPRGMAGVGLLAPNLNPRFSAIPTAVGGSKASNSLVWSDSGAPPQAEYADPKQYLKQLEHADLSALGGATRLVSLIERWSPYRSADHFDSLRRELTEFDMAGGMWLGRSEDLLTVGNFGSQREQIASSELAKDMASLGFKRATVVQPWVTQNRTARDRSAILFEKEDSLITHPNFLFRGGVTDARLATSEGMPALGTDLSLDEHAISSSNSAYVSTSYSLSTAAKWALNYTQNAAEGRVRKVFVIERPNEGVFDLAHHGTGWNYEMEVALLGGIQGRQVAGYIPVWRDMEGPVLGAFVPNERFAPTW